MGTQLAPSVDPAPAAVTMTGGLSGSNYGGHAPVVGSKVFLLQPGTSGYGSQATSLLTSAAGGTDTSLVGSSTNPAYYTTTDLSGYFNITGEYSCTPGMPVYVYAVGGSPNVDPAAGHSYLQSATGNGSTTTFTVDQEKMYVGQTVMFTGIPSGNPYYSLNGTVQTVTAISQTDNKSFSIASSVNGTSSNFGAIAIASPQASLNPGIVNVAVLGICPSPFTISASVLAANGQFLTGISASDAAKLANANVSPGTYTISGPGLPAGTTITYANVAGGTIVVSNADTLASGTSYTFTVTGPSSFGPSSVTPINFIYMNEVSTVAGMFALAPFAQTQDGTPTDAQHIGIPSGNAMALTGIQNAAVNAGQLYDITGATNDAHTTDGEAHIARSAVPNSGTGKGVATVPQALINTLGNILAQCVDSANTYGLGATGGTPSPACKQLFLNATSNGIPVSTLGSTSPSETATAALNIAHYPAGNGANAGQFVSNLFNIPSGVVPFQPVLSTAPKDFVIGINITVPQGSNPTNYLGSSGTTPAAAIPTAIATDAFGDAYVGTTGCGSGGAESSTNGYGCVLQLLPTQLLPGQPTVSGVGFVQGVRSIALGPAGKLWATGTLETGQTVNGYTPPAGAFYIVVNQVNPSAPLVTGASSTAQAFAAYGNTNVNSNPGTYTSYYGNPTAVVVDGNARAYIADSTKNYLHLISGENITPSYTTTNTDSEYLIQGAAAGANQNCLANVTAMAIGAQTPATTANGSGAYNVWTISAANTVTQGMCTIANPNVSGLTPQTGNTPLINTVTPVAQIGPAYTPTSLALDANDVGWYTNQSPSGSYNQTLEGLPNNGYAGYNSAFGFANSGTTTPTGVAVDGNNHLWVTNMGSNSVSVYTDNAPSPTPSGTAISPAGTGAGNGNGGYTAGSTLSAPAAIAIDPSGDVWVTNTGSSGVGYSVTELIGVAAPTYSGLAAAAANNKLGAKP